MIERHTAPAPDGCDVCAYVVSHAELNLDLRLDHTLAWMCQASLFHDLSEAREALPLQSLAVSGVGEPGPVTRFEPRHWF
jgi:hypothetical protein